MQTHHPLPPLPPKHEFLVLCARPETPLAPAPALAQPDDVQRRRLLADVDSMFWHPAHFGDDAA